MKDPVLPTPRQLGAVPWTGPNSGLARLLVIALAEQGGDPLPGDSEQGGDPVDAHLLGPQGRRLLAAPAVAGGGEQGQPAGKCYNECDASDDHGDRRRLSRA